MPDITLYFAPASRSFTPRWLLEEIGVPYSIKTIDLRRNEHKAPDYLRINPMGKVPALTDGAVTVSENPRSASTSPTATASVGLRRRSTIPEATWPPSR